MSAKIELFVGTPCYGGMLTEDYLHGILQLQNFCLENKIGLNVQTLGQESLITRARNTLVQLFMDGDYTHLMFIDADISLCTCLESESMKSFVNCFYAISDPF